MCDHSDLGAGARARGDAHAERLLLFERRRGGTGVAEQLRTSLPHLLGAALARVEACGCDRGRPSCVLLPGCGEYNEGLDKGGAALLLRWMVRGEEIEEPGVCKPCEAAS